MDKDWKLKLRYGRLTTPFTHYTAIAEGLVGKLASGFSCPPGPAFMGMKTWALDADESVDMIRSIGAQVGFEVTGRVHVYETEPSKPPRANPYGYDINFTPVES